MEFVYGGHDEELSSMMMIMTQIYKLNGTTVEDPRMRATNGRLYLIIIEANIFRENEL